MNQEPDRPSKFQVGDIVYRVYSPARCGVVTKIEWVRQEPRRDWGYMVTVQLNNKRKEIEIEHETGFQLFSDLIADHIKKLERHQNTLKKLQDLRDSLNIQWHD